MPQVTTQSIFTTDAATGKKVDLTKRVLGQLNSEASVDHIGTLMHDFVQLDKAYKADLLGSFKENFSMRQGLHMHPSSTTWTNVDFKTISYMYTEESQTWDVSQNIKWNDADRNNFIDHNNVDSIATQLSYWVMWRTIQTLEKNYEIMLDRASKYKLFGADESKTLDSARTSQPAKTTTTASTITAIQNGLRVSGVLTDVTPVKLVQLIRACIEKFMKYGSKRDPVEKYVPSILNGFRTPQLALHVEESLLKKMAESSNADVKKYVMSSDKDGLIFDARVSQIDGLKCKPSNWLPDGVLFAIFSKRSHSFQNTGWDGGEIISSLKEAEIEVDTDSAGSIKIDDAPLRTWKLKAALFYRTLNCFPGEAIFVKGTMV